jgi:hypothetical protein
MSDESIDNSVPTVPRDVRSPQPENSARPWRGWKPIAALVGGGLFIAGGAVMATLALTHRTAVTENLCAYLNGWSDCLAMSETCCDVPSCYY